VPQKSPDNSKRVVQKSPKRTCVRRRTGCKEPYLQQKSPTKEPYPHPTESLLTCLQEALMEWDASQVMCIESFPGIESFTRQYRIFYESQVMR